jgi:hypothetical protein
MLGTSIALVKLLIGGRSVNLELRGTGLRRPFFTVRLNTQYIARSAPSLMATLQDSVPLMATRAVLAGEDEG